MIIYQKVRAALCVAELAKRLFTTVLGNVIVEACVGQLMKLVTVRTTNEHAKTTFNY